MFEQILDIYKYLDKTNSSCALTIYYGLDLFADSFDDGMAMLQGKIKSLVDTGDYDSIDEINNICKSIKKIQDELKDCLNKIAKESKSNIVTDDKETDEIDIDINEDKQTVDYSKYFVNSNIKHKLDENFAHKRPCAFEFNGNKYQVSNWQDVLVKLCSVLAKNNKNYFDSFIDNNAFKGRKVSYFDKKSVPERNKLIPGTDVYVWVNLSANSIKALIKAILIESGIKPSMFFIYLRADYTPLRNESLNDFHFNYSVESKQKIGKYVRNVMRSLSNAGYSFSSEMLLSLQDKNKTKTILGINLPFLKPFDINLSLPMQTKDNKGKSRYWKEVFVFNGQKFLICSQWFEQNRQAFDEWVSSMNINIL